MLAQLIPPIPPVLLLALLPALAIIALPIVYVLYKLFSWFAPQKNRDTRSRIELLVASAVATIVLISTVGGLAFTFLGSATIHDHAEVKIIAQPGAHISTVVNEFGSHLSRMHIPMALKVIITPMAFLPATRLFVSRQTVVFLRSATATKNKRLSTMVR